MKRSLIVHFVSSHVVLTKFTVGSVPPVGHLSRIPILMDDGIPRDGHIYPAAGEINNAFETTFDKLLEITGAKVERISKQVTGD